MDLFTLPEFTLGQPSPEQQRPELSTLQEDGKPFRDNHLRTNEQLDFGCFHHHALLWQGKQTQTPLPMRGAALLLNTSKPTCQRWDLPGFILL